MAQKIGGTTVFVVKTKAETKSGEKYAGVNTALKVSCSTTTSTQHVVESIS